MFKQARQHWSTTFFTLSTPGYISLGAVLSLGVLSSIKSSAPGWALLEVSHLFFLFILAGGVASATRGASDWLRWMILGSIVLSVFLYVIQFGVGYAMHFTMESIGLWPDQYVGFGNLRHFNQYQTWTLPLLAVPVLILPSRWRILKGGIFGFLSVWWTLVIASNVRGAILAMVVATVGVGLLFRRQAWKWIAIQVSALLVGVGLYYFLFSPTMEGAPPVVDKVESGNYFRRIEHWLICLEMVASDPWLGAGPMHYAWPPINFTPGAHPHNAVMQWLGEWGLPSTLIMVGLTCWGGWTWMRQEKEKATSSDGASTALSVGLVAAIMAGAAHSMVSGIIVTPVSQIFLVLLGGWAWGRYQRRSQWPSAQTFSFRAHAALSILLIVSMAIIGSSLWDLSAAEERRTAFVQASDQTRLSPRYWAQGYIGVRDSSVVENARLEF